MTSARPGTFRSALGHHQLRWFLIHHGIAGSAQALGIVAVSLSLFEQTGSTRWVAAAGAGHLLPYLLVSGPAGVLVDRLDPRRVLWWSAVVRAVALGVLALAVAASAPAAAVVALVFVATALGTPCFPALAALVPTVVPADDLAPANGLLNTVETAAWSVGPALGSLLLLGGEPAFALGANAVLFAVGALALVPTTTPPADRAEEADEDEPFWTAFVAGLRVVVGSADVALPLFLVLVVNVVLGGATVGLLLVARDLLGTGQSGFSILTAALGVGGFAGVLATNRIAASRRPLVGIMVATVLGGVPFALLVVVTSPVLAIALMALAGGAAVAAEVAAMTLMLRALPQVVIARVFGLADALLVGSALVGALISPALIGLIGLKPSLLVVGAFLPASALVGAQRWARLADRGETKRLALAPRVALLAQQPWLADALPSALESLAVHGTEDTLVPGTVLIAQGDIPDDFFLLIDGEMVVTQSADGGPFVAIDHLLPGRSFGEIGLLERVPRTATVASIDAVRVLRIPGELFVGAVNSTPIASGGSVGAGLVSRLASGGRADGRVEPGE